MKTEISTDTNEWCNIDYRVQMITGKSSIKLIRAYKLDSQRDKQVRPNDFWVDAVVDLTNHTDEYCRLVQNRRASLDDVIFFAGHVNIHKYSGQQHKIFTFLICQINLGIIGNHTTQKLNDCDSILIPAEDDNDAFQYNFELKRHSQYVPIYEASFCVSADKQFSPRDYECRNCENRVPTIYCKTEKLYFCSECFEDHHQAKLMHTHDPEDLNKVNTLEACRNHNEKNEFFCLRCEKYLCPLCVQKGMHSQNGEHPVKLVSYLYEETAQNIQILPKKNLQKINILLENVYMKKREVADNETEIRTTLQRQYEDALGRLQAESLKKVYVLNSCELELMLLKDKIEWSQSFANFQKSTLKPVHYFKSESRFETLIKNMKIADFQAIIQCKADIVCEGNLQVGTRDNVPKSRGAEGFHQESPPKQTGSESLYKFNLNAQMPRKGELAVEIENSKMKFFQFLGFH